MGKSPLASKQRLGLSYTVPVNGDSPAADGVGAQVQALFEKIPASWQQSLAKLVDLDLAKFDWLGDESGRVAANLLLLLRQGWPEMLAFGGRLVLFAVGGSVLVGGVTALLAWVLYLVVAGPLMRRCWGTGRLIGCLSVAIVVLCAGFGGAWVGLWLGASKVMEEAIQERYVVERVSAAAFLAFTLEQEELGAEIDTERVEDLLVRAQARSADSWVAFRAKAENAAESAGLEQPGWLRSELVVGAVEQLVGDGVPDLATLHQVLSMEQAGDSADPLPQTAEIRKRAVELLRGTVYAQVLPATVLVLPLVGLVLLGSLGCLIGRGSSDRQEAGAERE